MEHADPVKLFTAVGLMLAIVLAGSAVSFFWEDIKRLSKEGWKRYMFVAHITSSDDVDETYEIIGTSTPVPDTNALVPHSIPPLGTSTVPVPDRPVPLLERDIITRHLPADDLAVLLAAQRDDDGQYTYSANAIAGFVKGKRRNDVLDLIRAVREPAPPSKPAPVFRELDEDGKPVLTHTA